MLARCTCIRPYPEPTDGGMSRADGGSDGGVPLSCSDEQRRAVADVGAADCAVVMG